MKKVLVLVAGIALLAAGSAGVGVAAPAKTLKVGMVTDSSGLNDRGFNHLAYVGLQQAQKRFGNTRFAIVDVANGDLAGKPKNVLGLLFREEQVGYLAGYLAGLEAKRK